MALSSTNRKWIAVLAIPLGVLLLWIGYAQDQARDRYYDCRQSAMDALHTNLTVHLDETDDPEVWVPNWREDFHNWHDTLAMCYKP